MEDNKLQEEQLTETIEEVKDVENTELVDSQEENTEEEKVEEKAPYDGPSVTVSTRYDYKTLKYFNIVSMVYKRHYPFLYLALALLCLAFAGYQVTKTLTAEEIIANQFIMPGVFVIFGVYSIYCFFNFEKSIDRNLTMHFNQTPEVSSVQCKVTLEGITVTSSKNPDQPSFFEWLFITQITEINEYYYLFAGRQPIIISKDVNNILEGDAETLKEIIDEQISKKPYRRIDKEILKNPITYVHQCDLNVTEVTEAEVTNVEENVTEEAIEEVTSEENTNNENNE